MKITDIQAIIGASIALKQAVLADEALQAQLAALGQACVQTYRQGGKTLWAGNGGSAADAQHLAAELSGRFYYDRPPLFAEALHVNSSYLTAVGNDYGYDHSFARILEAMAQPGDIFLAFSTSGNSPNILRAAEKARDKGMRVAGFTGQDGGQLRPLCEFWLGIPSKDTPRIQECHILLGHILCQYIEAALFPVV